MVVACMTINDVDIQTATNSKNEICFTFRTTNSNPPWPKAELCVLGNLKNVIRSVNANRYGNFRI
jgi:hypothetical protein